MTDNTDRVMHIIYIISLNFSLADRFHKLVAFVHD